jgi:hypothetical protein
MAHNSEYTAAFLRMTAIQMRELADYAPKIARELRHVADQLEAEAADIEAREGPVHRGRYDREARPEG